MAYHTSHRNSTPNSVSTKRITVDSRNNSSVKVADKDRVRSITSVTLHSCSSGISSVGSSESFSMADVEEFEKELDAIQANWPANRPSIKDDARRSLKKKKVKTVSIAEDPKEISDVGSDNSESDDTLPTEFRYIDENVVGRDTCFRGPYGERQGKLVDFILYVAKVETFLYLNYKLDITYIKNYIIFITRQI